MRVAIVHDWLVTYAGAERVLEQMLALFPAADLFSLIEFLPASERSFLGDRRVRTSFLQRVPFARTQYRQYLPLMPLAIGRFRLTGYDLVISSSHAVAKGVRTGPNQVHICMCYSPMRWAWDLQEQYLQGLGVNKGLRRLVLRYLLDRLRAWDVRTAAGVDAFIAISEHIARRIRTVYGRESVVIYPPVDVRAFSLCERKEDYFLTVSRMVPYKRLDLIVEAFSTMTDRTLLVIGDGPELHKLRAKAGPNVRMLGHQPLPVVVQHMQRARAFVFAAVEDFGIAPLEAQACGTPVVAYAAGAIPETIRGLDDSVPTGVFFREQTVPALVSAVRRFESEESRITPEACRRNALRFTPERFRESFSTYVAAEVESFRDLRAVTRSGVGH